MLTAKEAEQVLAQPDVSDLEGLRDRAMLETFYATGMRRMEVANLKLFDIDQDRGTVMIRQGKGKKDRHIPIGERALAWIAKYASDARPRPARRHRRRHAVPDAAGHRVRARAADQAGADLSGEVETGKVGGCHLWRHTVATLMLENGADVRVIQELLGHAKLSTTELYTRVSIKLLKQVYAATHPAAKLLADLGEERVKEDPERARASASKSASNPRAIKCFDSLRQNGKPARRGCPSDIRSALRRS